MGNIDAAGKKSFPYCTLSSVKTIGPFTNVPEREQTRAHRPSHHRRTVRQTTMTISNTRLESISVVHRSGTPWFEPRMPTVARPRTPCRASLVMSLGLVNAFFAGVSVGASSVLNPILLEPEHEVE